jgi:hypothetical protein
VSDQEDQNSEANHDSLLTEIQYRKVPAINGKLWLIQALEIFKANPKTWLASMIVMMLILGLIPFIQVFTPVFTAGLMYACLRLKNNQDFKLNHLFKGFNEQFNQLALIGLIYLGCALISYLIADSVATSLGYPLVEITPEMINSGNISMETLRAYSISISIIMLIVMALMMPVFMAFWFAPALIMLRKCHPIVALKASFNGCLANMMAFLYYGIVGLAVLILLSVLLVALYSIFQLLSLVLLILSTLIFAAIFYASMFTSFEDVFGAQKIQDNGSDNENPNNNNPDDDEGPSSIII